jgi:hypothetical protein
MLDIAADLKRVRRLRRSLEPLATLYEKAVLEACKEPFEVRLKIRQSTDHLRENYHGAETVHIIDEEPLQAAHEVWQEYHRIENELDWKSRKLREQSRAALSEQLPDGLDSLSAPERAWLEWFYSLSEEDKKIVEISGEKGISATPANLDEMKKIIMECDTDDSRLNQ